MLDHRRGGKKGPYDRAPLGKQRRLAKSDGVVFQGVPENLQHIPLGVFNPAVHLGALVALGAYRHGRQAPCNGFFKGGLLAGLDADVGELKNHGVSVSQCAPDHGLTSLCCIPMRAHR